MTSTGDTQGSRGTGNTFQREKRYIAFGPQMREAKTLPEGLAEVCEDARDSIQKLYRSALRGENLELTIEQLVEIGALAAGFIEGLWGSARYRAILESVAVRRFDFPVLHAGAGVIGHKQREEMKKSLPLAGTSRHWQKASGAEDDLKRELLWFFMGVHNPNWLRFVEGHEECDVIDQTKRAQLCRPTGKVLLKEWTQAFEDYVRSYRADLLSTDGKQGRFSHLAELKQKTYRIKNPWDAFVRFVRDQFRTLLKVRQSKGVAE